MSHKLERLCEFADGCSEGGYGDEEICKTDYENCPRYKEFMKEYEKNQKDWNWWRY